MGVLGSRYCGMNWFFDRHCLRLEDRWFVYVFATGVQHALVPMAEVQVAMLALEPLVQVFPVAVQGQTGLGVVPADARALAEDAAEPPAFDHLGHVLLGDLHPGRAGGPLQLGQVAQDVDLVEVPERHDHLLGSTLLPRPLGQAGFGREARVRDHVRHHRGLTLEGEIAQATSVLRVGVDILFGVVGFGGRCSAVTVRILVGFKGQVVLELAAARRTDEQREFHLFALFFVGLATNIPRLKKIRLHPVVQVQAAHVFGPAGLRLRLGPITGLHVVEQSGGPVLLRPVILPLVVAVEKPVAVLEQGGGGGQLVGFQTALALASIKRN